MEQITFDVIKFLKELESRYNSLEKLLNEENFLEAKKEITRYINNLLNKNKLSQWQIRKLVDDVFSKLGIELSEHSVLKVLFLLFTDVLNERIPSPSPLYFTVDGRKIPKRNAIITDFDLYPFLREKVFELNPEKKHKVLFEIFSDGKLASEGVSYYLSVFDYFLFLLLDKALYEEVIQIDEILVSKDKELTVDKDTLNLLLQFLFNGVYEFYTGEKQNLSLLKPEKAKSYVKAKKLVANTLKDKNEEMFFIELAIDDEFLSENRKEYVRQEEVQRQVLQEAKDRDVPEVEKLEAVVWLIGLENLEPELVFQYFDVEAFIDTIKLIENDINTDKETFEAALEKFLKELFSMYDISLDKKELLETLVQEHPNLIPDYLFWTGDYDGFLTVEKPTSPENDLKTLYAKYKIGEISKDEFKNWLVLFQDKVDKSLLDFVSNG